MGIFKKFFEKLKYVFKRTELDADFYDELEALLVSSDMGVETAMDIINELRQVCKQKLIKDVNQAEIELKNILIDKLGGKEIRFEYPLIITVVGVNGVGKTTSIAKMAKYFQSIGKSVMLAAGDTFRAAATEQLDTWAQKLKVKIAVSNTRVFLSTSNAFKQQNVQNEIVIPTILCAIATVTPTSCTKPLIICRTGCTNNKNKGCTLVL